MLRRSFLISALSLLAVPAHAEGAKLSAAEIYDLLNGNTVSGTWGGKPYKSYYSTDGVTVYVPASGGAERGRWRVNYDTNQYESWWEHSGWTGYTIRRAGSGYTWEYSGGQEPFTVLEGRQVSW